MTPELEPVAVLADRLQAGGDPRGELLSLELAAALADSTEDSRRLCTAAAALRSKHPQRAWPPALASSLGLSRAGLLVAGVWSPRQAPGLVASLDPSCRELVVLPDRGNIGLHEIHDAYTRVGLRLDGLWEHRRSMSDPAIDLGLHRGQSLELAALGIAGPVTSLDVLGQLRGLVELKMSGLPSSPALFAQLAKLGLRSLTVWPANSEHLCEILDACPRLEQLTLTDFSEPLQPHPHLERLRSLSIIDHRPRKPTIKLPEGLSLPRLESLLVSGPTLADLQRIAALRLRRLTVYGPVGGANAIVAALAKLDSLEHLCLLLQHGQAAEVAPLSALSRLRSLELGRGLTGELRAPRSLEHLVLRGGGVRVHGRIASIHCGTSTFLHVPDRLDLAQTKTLSLAASPRSLERHERPSELLASVETLEIDHDGVEPSWIDQLPRLRTVIWPYKTIAEQRAAAERWPYLQILGADAARLRETWGRPTNFDLLAPRNWPKYA